ncbi:hypothetical protein [Amycolatopsis sp. CA-230715]|uniref:hypothetical protein n=1 Tax=Amycolatopsis sp. CA-230715 TaxID=2745196 RepID=UPI001C01381B|nr:hypothetical protein [Amycolatopsis sp. CA-230715]QWF80125.1 hypothetical protein HUW46_03543 [Amycolatopsis sp. CA-230715]
MIIEFSSTRTAAAPVRKLDALAVEAALNGRRAYDELHPREVFEVVRIARRRGNTLDQVAELLDVDFFMIADEYDAAGA